MPGQHQKKAVISLDQAEPHRHAALLYWEQSDEHRIQRYYIALCLLMASIQDALLGQVERKFRNLNWSATVSYYSLVHAGRLLVFIAAGDYPTRHVSLRDLFNGDPVRLNWLRSHREFARAPTAPNPMATLDVVGARLAELGMEEVLPRLTQFGAALTASAELRSDSNYEALLVAHEYDHALVSFAFERLSIALATAAEEGLWLAVDAFNGLRRETPEAFRPALESLVTTFFQRRIVPALENKIRGHEGGERVLQTLRERLQLNGLAMRDLQLEERLQMQFFGGKTRLMDRFRQRIIELEEAVGTFDPLVWDRWQHMPPGFPRWQR